MRCLEKLLADAGVDTGRRTLGSLRRDVVVLFRSLPRCQGDIERLRDWYQEKVELLQAHIDRLRETRAVLWEKYFHADRRIPVSNSGNSQEHHQCAEAHPAARANLAGQTLRN